MSFPPPNLCITLPEVPSAEDICLPGGICLSYVWDSIGKLPSYADVSMDFFSQIGPALTPLKPFFDLLDTVLSIFKCVTAIPKSILTLNPGELLNCFPALAKAVDQVLKLIPQLSIPKMIKAVLKNMALMLRSIADEFDYLGREFQRIARAIDRAADLNDPNMNAYLVCAQNDAEGAALSTAQALQGIGRIILLINVFIGLLGGEEIPCFGSLVTDNIDQLDVVTDLLYTLADLLETMANAIPDPDLILSLALGDLKC